MFDQLMGWLLPTVFMLGLIASAVASLAKILASADHMLGSVLSMRKRMRNFRRRSAVVPDRRQKPVTKRRNGKCGMMDNSPSA